MEEKYIVMDAHGEFILVREVRIIVQMYNEIIMEIRMRHKISLQ